jgi:signal transduction histidine kinase
VAAATTWVDWNDDTTLAFAMTALAAFALVEAVRTRRSATRDELAGLGALLLLTIWAFAVPHFGTSGDWRLQPIAFDAGVALAGIWLFVLLPSPGDLSERAIQLDESTGTVRDALAELLADPGLQIGFATDEGEFIGESGRPLAPAPYGRRTTKLADRAGLVGVVVHEPDVLMTEDDRDALVVAVSLARTRARLRDELRQRAEDLSRSTVRLIRSGDDEQLRLSARVEAGVGTRLRETERLMAAARASVTDDAQLEAALDRANAQIDHARRDLAALGDGIAGPALMAGLPAAVAGLVEGLPLEVDTRVGELDLAPELAATIWFVCSEGIANVLKHASASRLLVTVSPRDASIEVVVEDDGCGGANAAGTGLSGLSDRVAALGGHLRLETPRIAGTRLVALLPCETPC